MNRVKSPLFWIGLALTGLAVAVLFIGAKSGGPSAVEVPVARQDIPAGTTITKDLFYLDKFAGATGKTMSQYVTRDEFMPYVGATTVETVHAGFPLGKAQVAVDENGEPNVRIQRLTLMVQEEGKLVFPLPVEADTAGNYIQAGDYVDLIFSVGMMNVREMDNPPEPTPTPPSIGLSAGPPGMDQGGEDQPDEADQAETEAVTETLRLPLTKLAIQNVPVLRVEREMVRSGSTYPSTSSGQASSAGLGSAPQSQPTYAEGDVQRLYVALSPDQLEIISFILYNGDVRVAAHATIYPDAPTEGLTWDDFEDWFFEQRESLETRER